SHLALKSATFAAKVASEQISEGDFSAEKMARYQKLWTDEFPPYGKILKGKSALFELSDDDMSLMAQCFPDEMSNMGPHGKLAVCLRILMRRPSLYGKKIIPAMLSFGYSRAKYYGW
ncbi:MAG TPA: hypothetical protein QGF70_01490, partial [Candidatus Thalassarchaeaceae archaeon]|nr:hypothetical protein [Candidatus Thalassarchaeaceae archaeon]